MPIVKSQVGSFKSGIESTIALIKKEKAIAEAEGRTYRVIDVGGGKWSKAWDGLLTAAVDLVVPENSEIEFFQIDIEDELSWQKAEPRLMRDGQYDFVICRHTLEDLSFPRTCARWLKKIAKAGAISVPSHLTELARSCDHDRVATKGEPEGKLQLTRGYLHHKWIFFTGKDDTIVAYPKMVWQSELTDEWYSTRNCPGDQFAGFFNCEPFPQDLTYFWAVDFEFVQLNNSLVVDAELYDRHQKMIGIFGFDVYENWKRRGGGAVTMPDWEALTYLLMYCGFTQELIDHCRAIQASWQDEWKTKLLGDATNLEFWYLLSNIMGWGFGVDPEKDCPWLVFEDGRLSGVNLKEYCTIAGGVWVNSETGETMGPMTTKEE